jgi:ATP-dependent Clp protease ATP-binding subunit ClpA
MSFGCGLWPRQDLGGLKCMSWSTGVVVVVYPDGMAGHVMYERFTVRARQVMELSRLEAVRCRHPYIGTEHLLLGLVREGTGIATRILQSHAVNLEVVRAEIETIVQSGTDRVSLRHLKQTPRAKKVIEFSIEEAHDLQHGYVGTEHLLLGLLREQEGVAAQVLTRLGLRADGVRKQIVELHERSDVVPEAALRMHASAPPSRHPGTWKKIGEWFRDAFTGN